MTDPLYLKRISWKASEHQIRHEYREVLKSLKLVAMRVLDLVLGVFIKLALQSVENLGQYSDGK
jgi:hypothetical protein